jgi:3-hydroxy acid dehydrogenase/malonic semialdehyde reductase
MNSLRTTGRSFGRHFRIASGLFSAAVYQPSGVLQTPRIVQSQIFSNHIFNRTMASAVAKRLEGKTVVITGASSGIGYSTAKEFARTSPANLKIVVTARRVDKLEQLAKEIKEEVGDGVKVLPVALDVSDPQQVKDFIPSLPAEFQEIDVLVNNA